MQTTYEWTPQRVNALIALWDEGLPTSEIGRRLGITKNAVIGKVHRLGLAKRGSPIKERPDQPQVNENLVTMAKPYCRSHCAKAYIRITKDGRKVAAA